MLFVGRLQARKRIDVLLQGCALLPEELQPRLWVVGEGPARGELQELAKRVYPQAEFPGDQRVPICSPTFAAADLFALPGTGGLAVQEAMAAGLPVIVAEGDGTQDDLVRPDNGWQAPPCVCAGAGSRIATGAFRSLPRALYGRRTRPAGA